MAINLAEIEAEAVLLALYEIEDLIEAGATPRKALAVYRQRLNDRVDAIYA